MAFIFCENSVKGAVTWTIQNVAVASGKTPTTQEILSTSGLVNWENV